MFNLLRWSKALKNNQKGFTLVELMVVVVIIGVLVAIAIPIYGGIQDSAAQNAHDANLRTIDGVLSMYEAEHGDRPPDAGEIGPEHELVDPQQAGLLEDAPIIPERLEEGDLEGDYEGGDHYGIADGRAAPVGTWGGYRDDDDNDDDN